MLFNKGKYPMEIVSTPYGKGKINLFKINKSNAKHSVNEVTVEVVLNGELEKSYITPDNGDVVPTDTIKNTVYALAKDHEMNDIESFGVKLAQRYVNRYPKIKEARVTLVEHPWESLVVSDGEHNHAFKQKGPEHKVVEVVAKGSFVKVTSGITDLFVCKTTCSGFLGFSKCEYTTLPEVTDRTLKTNITANWTYSYAPREGYTETAKAIKQTLIDSFAGPALEGTHSPSVQHTQYQMGTMVLDRFPSVDEIYLSMPNIHMWSAGLERFGMKDDKCVLIPASDPHGIVELKLRRPKSKM